MSEWIKVTDRLPLDSREVLIYGVSKWSTVECVMIGLYKHGWWFETNNGDYVDGGYGDDYPAIVTCWQTLPEAPEL